MNLMDTGTKTATRTSASVLCTWLLLCLCPVVASVDITASPGENVTLSCSVTKNILIVEWRRRDLTQYIFLYRDGRSDPDNQRQSYTNRVELQDKQMKDGNVSLVLKNFTVNDTGTYQCHVLSEPGRRKSNVPICIINLTVFQPGGDEHGGDEDGGDKDKRNKAEGDEGNKDVKGGENVGLKVGLSVFGVLLVAGIIGVVIYRKRKGLKEETSYKPPDEKDTEHQ